MFGASLGTMTQLKLPPENRLRWIARHAEKRAMMARMRATGMTQQQIADALGVTRQRVNAALKREGVK